MVAQDEKSRGARGRGWAPGKVILLGEHAVVYGHPAVAAALDRGVTVVVRTDPQGPRLRSPAGPVDTALSLDAAALPIGQALERVRQAVAPQLRDIVLEADDGLPLGAGLGSSAGLAVAAARALADAAGTVLDTARLAEVVREAEQVFHGTPSGVDQATVVHGGILRFQRQGADLAGRPLVTPLRPARPLSLVVAMKRPHWGTKEAVAALRARRERHPRTINLLLTELGALADEGARAVVDADVGTLGALMDLAHGILGALGVSSLDLEELVGFARQHGARGAKLTGAGVGGCIISVVDNDTAAASLVEAFQTQGASAFACVLGRPGEG